MAKKYIKSFVTRSLVCVILFLLISIVCNFSDKNLLWFKNNIYDKEEVKEIKKIPDIKEDTIISNLNLPGINEDTFIDIDGKNYIK